ncbi:MAG: GldG family protein [Oscillospiraceae bacterium]|jgi:hypothetical protein|nr:GldG family protein [Oscillospiraceae bacterium]
MKFFQSPKFRYGGLSVLFTLLFIALVILLNVVAGKLSDRYGGSADLSDNKLFTIEKSTDEYLSNLSGKVNIYITASEDDYVAQGIQYRQTAEIAKLFANHNNVTLKFVDYIKDPSFTTKFSTDLVPVTQNCIIIESEATGRFKVVKPAQYIKVRYFFNGQEISSSDAQAYSLYGMTPTVDYSAAAEQSFMSAFLSANSTENIRVAFTTGFGEGEYASSAGGVGRIYDKFDELLQTNAYTVEKLDFNVVRAVDDDIDWLVIFAPGVDYDAETLSFISTWLDKGGKNLIYVSSEGIKDLDNLNAFLSAKGLTVEDSVVFQTNKQYAYADAYGYNQILELPSGSEYAEGISDGTLMAMYGVNRVVTVSGDNATAIITSKDGAVPYPFNADENWNPANYTAGKLAVAAVSIGEAPGGKSRVFVFGGPNLFYQETLENTRLSNERLYLNIFNVISGREQTAAITPKSFSYATFTVTKAQANTLALVFCVALPLLITGVGIFMYIKRRYK